MTWNGLNDDQREHVRSLDKVPPEEKCVSGWHLLSSGPCDCAERRAKVASVPVPEDEQNMRRRVVYLLDNDINGEPMSLARDMLTLLDRLTALRERLRMSDKGYAIRTAEVARLTEENQRLRGRVEELERLVVEPHDVREAVLSVVRGHFLGAVHGWVRLSSIAERIEREVRSLPAARVVPVSAIEAAMKDSTYERPGSSAYRTLYMALESLVGAPVPPVGDDTTEETP